MAARSIAALSALVLAAGCGGGGGGRFDAPATKGCIEERSEHNVELARAGSLMAEAFDADTLEGLAVNTLNRDPSGPKNDAALLFFQRDDDSAERRLDRAQTLAERQRNVVIVWGTEPRAEFRRLVEDCLSES